MTIEEIFIKLASHMEEGVKIHNEMATAFDFLGLEGFARMHNAHAQEEQNNYLHLLYYYSYHYHKLIKEETNFQKLIPDNWYKYSSMAIDNNTKRSATKEFMEKWVAWEQTTKKLYQEMRQELCSLGEIAAALEIDKYIKDVDKELAHAQKKLIKLESIGYDIITIIEWSDHFKIKYKKKLGW